MQVDSESAVSLHAGNGLMNQNGKYTCNMLRWNSEQNKVQTRLIPHLISPFLLRRAGGAPKSKSRTTSKSNSHVDNKSANGFL